MKGPNLAQMAWRNLWRNRRRSLLTLSSMAFGIMLAVLFTGLGDAGYGRMIDLAARMGGGHVTLQDPEMLDRPSLGRTVEHTDELTRIAKEDPSVSRVVTRISGQVLLGTARQSRGAGFVAFDPRVEDRSTFSLLDALDEGEMFDGPDAKGIILGKRLSEQLGAGMGRKVVYTFTDKDGQIVSGLARVSGIIRTGAPSVDGSLCLLPINVVRRALGYAPDEATEVDLFVSDHRISAALAARLAPRLPAGTVALPWFESKPELAGFIAMKVNGTLFMEVLIMLLVAAGIFNQILVSVMERTREFGIMMAIGFSPWRLSRLVMWECGWLAIVGVVAGGLVTALPYYLGATKGLDLSAMTGQGSTEVAGVALDPIWKIAIYPGHAVAIVAAVVLATLASGLYPAWRAGRVAPVDSIKLV